MPRHPDQAHRAWIATEETAAFPGTPSGKVETSLSPCIPIDQRAFLPLGTEAASSAARGAFLLLPIDPMTEGL